MASSDLASAIERELALAEAREGIELEGEDSDILVCQGPPVCFFQRDRDNTEADQHQENCPFCRVERYDAELRRWHVTDPMELKLQ